MTYPDEVKRVAQKIGVTTKEMEAIRQVLFDELNINPFRENLFELFKAYHRGKSNSIKRVDLLGLINEFYVECTDREMRQAYEDLPICGSSKGLYLLKTETERNEQIALHMKKIFSYWRKIRVLREYKIESDAIQKELF